MKTYKYLKDLKHFAILKTLSEYDGGIGAKVTKRGDTYCINYANNDARPEHDYQECTKEKAELEILFNKSGIIHLKQVKL